MTDLPDEAVEAAARALCVVTNYGTLGPRCDTHEWVVPIKDPTHCEYGDEIASAVLTAAAPHIAAQERTTAGAMTELFKAGHEKSRDLRARIEALRDEWRAAADAAFAAYPNPIGTRDGFPRGYASAQSAHADALDALLREGE